MPIEKPNFDSNLPDVPFTRNARVRIPRQSNPEDTFETIAVTSTTNTVGGRPNYISALHNKLAVATFGTPNRTDFYSINPQTGVLTLGTSGSGPFTIYQTDWEPTATYAFTVSASGNNLTSWNASNINSVFIADQISAGAQPFGASISPDGNIAAVATTSSGVGLRLFDVSNPASMSLISTFPGKGYASVKFVDNTRLVAAAFTAGQMTCVDVSNPAAPVEVGNVSLGTNVRRVASYGPTAAYVKRRNSGAFPGDVVVVDISTFASPVVVTNLPVPNISDESEIHAREGYLVTGTGDISPGTVKMYDLRSDPLNPILQNELAFGGGPENTVFSVEHFRDFLFTCNRQFQPNSFIRVIPVRETPREE
jgi:hypothetical protein